MKPIIFAVMAMIFYAIGNVIMERYFSKYNNLTIIVCYSVILLIAAMSIRQLVKTSDQSFNFPMGWIFALVVVMGCLFFLADYFYIGAYTNGGNLMAITTIAIMMPVFASAIKFCFENKMPNLWQIAGYVMAALAVFCIIKGNPASN